METSGLLLLILLGLVVWFWQDTIARRDQAISAATDACRAQQLQLLDDTVALQRIALRRSAEGNIALERTFQFAYSLDGMQRKNGFIILLGNRITHVGL